jgi:hypothetical protein
LLGHAAVGGGERILRREEGVVGITPSSLLKHFAPWAPAQKKKFSINKLNKKYKLF